jgi:hypothetical protein
MDNDHTTAAELAYLLQCAVENMRSADPENAERIREARYRIAFKLEQAAKQLLAAPSSTEVSAQTAPAWDWGVAFTGYQIGRSQPAASSESIDTPELRALMEGDTLSAEARIAHIESLIAARVAQAAPDAVRNAALEEAAQAIDKYGDASLESEQLEAAITCMHIIRALKRTPADDSQPAVGAAGQEGGVS